jgi:RNA polymerase sigma-70 factor (ECF subfamily)
MFSIARNQALLHRRKRIPEPIDGSLGPAVSAADPGPEQMVLARADAAVVATHVASLRPIHREVLHLAFVQELSGQEMARVLGVPVGTVKSRLHHAKRELADRLANRSPTL